MPGQNYYPSQIVSALGSEGWVDFRPWLELGTIAGNIGFRFGGLINSYLAKVYVLFELIHSSQRESFLIWRVAFQKTTK